MNRPRPALPWIFTGLYALLIFLASSFSGRDLPETFSGFDKLCHFLEYFPLGLLLMWAFRSSWNRSRIHTLLTVAFVVMLYALTDELHQFFVPGRSPDVLDGAMDVLGGVIGGVFYPWPK
ncbi:MAG: VanZ family protein [Candidatus Omnitrophica bacterium]|nr:VanZ family protein [Candidatus Omnitrophota bacterium]MDD5573979.1 VanZ family protein [Candidatus Omnitrophota bacterium]